MASVVTLAKAKAQLRVTSNAEDDLITDLIADATEYIWKYCNFDSANDIPGIGDSPAAVPADIRQAALMLITAAYENRGYQIDQTIKENPAVKERLYPYRQDIGI